MSYSQQNPYSSAEQGYGQQQGGYEMQDYQNNSAAPSSAPTTLATNDFLQRIAQLRNEIGTVSDNVNAISSLHQRALAESDAGLSAQQLERIMTETQAMNRGIRDQLKYLATDAAHTQDAGAKHTKEKQVQTMSDNFKRELRKYQEAEQAYQQRYRDQIARQYRIVNPDATEEEVRQAAEADWGNEGVFQTALRTNRTGQATSVLGNVRARHNELQRIEQTIMELARMFEDLAVLVEQQEAPIDNIEQKAHQTTDHMDRGNEEVGKGIDHARRTRKMKWYCVLICVLIIVILALILGIYFGITNKNNNNNNNNGGGGQ